MKSKFWIHFWLWTFPPIGIWLLYKNQDMTRAGKVRLVVYSILVPLLLMTAVSVYMIHSTKVMLAGMDPNL